VRFRSDDANLNSAPLLTARAAKLRLDASVRKLTAAKRSRSCEDSSPTFEQSAFSRLPLSLHKRYRGSGSVIPVYLSKADADVGLSSYERGHRQARLLGLLLPVLVQNEIRFSYRLVGGRRDSLE
jgi:hypothetical protein